MSSNDRRAAKAWRDDLERRAQNLLQAQRRDADEQEQAEAAEREHAMRVAYVQQWQQAWSDANGGAAPPEGLMPPLPPADLAPADIEQPGSTRRVGGITLIIAGIGVFALCAVIQAALGTSMFSSRYTQTSTSAGIIVNLTFWPGWVATCLLIASGIQRLVRTRPQS